MGQTSNTDVNGLIAHTAGNAASADIPITHELGKGCALASGTDYYFVLNGNTDATLQHVTLKWDSTIVVTWSLECTSIPAKKHNNDASADLKAWDNTAGNGWNQEPITSTSVSVTDTTGATGGATISSNTIVVAGGTAGSASMHIGNLGSRRGRIKAHVVTGGVARVCAAGKE